MAEVINVQAPDQAPIAAPSLTQFADLEKTPQANTAVLPDADALNNQMIQAAQYRHAWEEADYQRQQKAIANKIDKMNINTAGAWEVDMPEIQKELNSYLDYVGQHPELETPNAKNLQQYTQLQESKNQILADIDKSKQDKAMFNEQQKFIQNHSDQRWNNDYNNGILRDFGNFNSSTGKSLRDRKWTGYKAPDFYNPLTKIDFGEIQKTKHTFNTGKGDEKESIDTEERTPTQILGALQNYKQGQDYVDFANHYNQIKSNIIQGKQPDYNITVPVIEKGYDRKTKYFPTYQIPVSHASLDEILRSDKVPSGAAYNELQGLQGDATKGVKDLSDIDASVDTVHNMFFNNNMKGNYNEDLHAYSLNSEYPQIANQFKAKIPQFKTDDDGKIVPETDKNGNQVKTYETPQIFIKNDIQDPSKSRAILLYSDGSKKEVAPEQLIEADLGTRGKSARDYSARMKQVNGDGTASYNPQKYQQSSGGSLPLEGRYTQGVQGEQKNPIDINYNQQQSQPTQQSYAPNIEAGIDAVVKANGITREQAIDALKKAGKL